MRQLFYSHVTKQHYKIMEIQLAAEKLWGE